MLGTNLILPGFIFFIIAVIGINDAYTHWELSRSKTLVGKYEAEIMNLEAESKARIEKVNAATLHAENQIRMDHAQDVKIENANVPSDCQRAVNWALKQAQTIK